MITSVQSSLPCLRSLQCSSFQLYSWFWGLQCVYLRLIPRTGRMLTCFLCCSVRVCTSSFGRRFHHCPSCVHANCVCFIKTPLADGSCTIWYLASPMYLLVKSARSMRHSCTVPPVHDGTGRSRCSTRASGTCNRLESVQCKYIQYVKAPACADGGYVC